MYVTRFNAVDLADRYYAKVVDGHRVLNWHTKLFYAIVKLGMINVYVASMIEEWNDWAKFRLLLAKELISLDHE